ncbi:flagellar biosynthetic protein FliO [Mobilicoccus caccae]|uniref:Flagellar protein n=1 Tax=Mobilicoccus caccae TaxID=1859295 RepID=A0ABQ6IT01_9MICO|nr:flagellar biosynthetic protein FliO [Mobilicoccus caccae]GMA41045.1 hypothetical protein GCM10025883_30900 [Mobilicoccus caccae]
MTDGSLALTLLRAVISLALVLGLLVLCMRVLARRGGFAPSSRVTPVDIDVLGRKQLSRGSSVQVVRVGRRVLVLGVTDSRVSVLTHLSAGEVPADGNAETEDSVTQDGPRPASVGLLDALRRQGRTGRLIADATGAGRGGRHRGGSRV